VVKSRFLHNLRTLASFALLGAASAGALLSWIPAIGIGVLGVHEIGALVGLGAGMVANARQLV